MKVKMIKNKAMYLEKITSSMRLRTRELGTEVEGSSPPSVFVGRWNYPKVYAGPMIPPAHGDTRVMDTPEEWIPSGIGQEKLISYRLSLVRGKAPVRVNDVDSPLVRKLQEVALAERSVDSEMSFTKSPRGMSIGEERPPHGPSGPLREFQIGNTRWNRDLERSYYDTDLKASEAITELHRRGVNFSSIEKALSVGALGRGKKRKLVPTRWSITACDSTIGNHLLGEVRHNDVLDTYLVYETENLNNRYAVILTPTPWQYEWVEAFMHILGREVMIFSDHEHNPGKKGYSSVGGCYYSAKMAALEALYRMRRQAGVFILREAHSGYVPMGVFNVRENVRAAMRATPVEFEDLASALAYLGGRFTLPMKAFMRHAPLLRDTLHHRQTTLFEFT